MSLAMFAAPFNENSINDNDNLINKKRQTHNKTQKRYPKQEFDTQKVNSVLEKIHNNSDIDEEDGKEGLADFNPPPNPESSGVNKTIATEQMMNMSNQNNNTMFRTLGRSPQPNSTGDNNLDLNDYTNYGDSKSIEEYYKKVLPGYNPNREPINRQYYKQNVVNNYSDTSSFSGNSDDVLIQKINYMISLLEEQQDEKTNNVTEEVVLYSFLGIFIIFIVDSFARVGKYVR
jgi:hypothetical protein